MLENKTTIQNNDIYYDSKKPNKKNEKKPPSLMEAELKSRVVFLSGPVDKDSAHKLTKYLLLQDELSSDPIKLFINSPGGEVNSGFSIFDCIRFVRSPVYVIGAGLVASAAALVYLAVPKERRLSFPHARYLLHQPLSGMQGVVSDLEIYSKEIENIKSIINTIIANGTGQKMNTVEKDTDRDFWLTSQDAHQYGLVGKIVDNKDSLNSVFKKPESSNLKSDNKTKKDGAETKKLKKATVTKKTSAKKATTKKTSAKKSATKKTSAKK